ATATLTGQYLGAEQPETAAHHIRRALLINSLVTAVICGSIALFPGWFMSIFTDSKEVIETGIMYLRIFATGFIFVSATIVLTRVFQGAGDTVWPALVMLCRLGIFAVGALLMGWLWDLQEIGIWLAYMGAGILQLIIISVIYRMGTWKRRNLRVVKG
ncbi:MAG: MATE family efflux transporter, partial [Lentisphaeria bacterium]